MFMKIYQAVSVLALMFLFFMLGSITTKFEIWPYQLLDKPYQGFLALAYAIENSQDSPHVWAEATHGFEKSGVTRYDTEKAYNGFTLYAPAHEHKAYLIDMQGNKVHSWAMPFSQLWPNPAHTTLKEPTPDHQIVWRGMYLYPNGDLLAVYNAVITPTGHGLVKLDKDSNVIWSLPIRAHHYVDVGDDGRIYTLTLDIHMKGVEGVDGFDFPILEDNVAVISADGEVLKEISLIKAFANSPYFADVTDYMTRKRRLDVDMSTAAGGDVLHTNTVSYIDKEAADGSLMFEEGQLLLSMRELDMLAVMDPETEQIVWAMRGFWRAQHSPKLLPNGRIMLFDNQGPQGGQYSRVVEFGPVTGKIYWSYTGTEDEPFYSYIRSHQDPLPNGNVLVTSFQNGRVFEVTRDNKIVWEYYSPDRLPGHANRVSGLHGAMRFTQEDLTFLSDRKI